MIMLQSSARRTPSSTPDQHPTLPHEAANEATYSAGVVIDGEKLRDNAPPQTPVVHDALRPSDHNVRPKNVVIFGETGVGKSSVINLIAGTEIARTSSDLVGCTQNAEDYRFNVEGIPLKIYDTVGLEEPETSTNTAFFRAIENACQLIHTLNSAGGIDLFLFCINGGRITGGTQRSHRLFSEFLCEKKIPLVVIVTHLETENNMDDWWVQNKETLRRYGINPVAHACITASTAERDKIKQKQSQTAVRELLSAMLTTSDHSSLFARKWIIDIILRVQEFFKLWKPKEVHRKDFQRRLEERCTLSPDEAKQVADIVLGKATG